MALPRGTCTVCHRDIAVRVNGEAREHQAWDAEDRRYRKCKGSGKKADAPAA